MALYIRILKSLSEFFKSNALNENPVHVKHKIQYNYEHCSLPIYKNQ